MMARKNKRIEGWKEGKIGEQRDKGWVQNDKQSEAKSE